MLAQIDENNFDCFVLGSYFLSSGGGFESLGAKFFVQQQLKKREALFLPAMSLADKDKLVPLTFLGCPAIETEKNHNISHFERLIKTVRKDQGIEITSFLLCTS